MVKLLLPPSEAKAVGGTGPALARIGLGPKPLAVPRRRVLSSVATLCREDPAAATVALKLPASSARDAIAANVAVFDAPTMPAIERFTGVLFAALDVATLPSKARAIAGRDIAVFAGAFGVVTGDERIPDHRVPAAATVPGLGGLTPLWRTVLRSVMPSWVGDELVVDLRSSDYAALWPVTGPLRAQVVPVRVLTERRVGRSWVRSTVSHPSKHGKGLLARRLLLDAASCRPARSAADVAAAGERCGFTVECRALAGGQVGVDLVTRQ